MSVDVVEQLGNGIKLLLDSSADLETKEEVLDCLEDWLGTIDMACNFHKIGGFIAITQCLASPHASLEQECERLTHHYQSSEFRGSLFRQVSILHITKLPVMYIQNYIMYSNQKTGPRRI